MSETWRAMDTGLRPAAQNIALSRALLESRHADEIPSTLRFLRFARCALIGSRQSAAQELDLGYCKSAGIAVQRHITGGDAVCCDERQLGWELYLHRRDVGKSDMAAVARRICHAVATALGALGVDARLRARHEIEIDGRVVARGAAAAEADALLYRGILMIDAGEGELQGALRGPGTPWLGVAPRLAHARSTDLKTALGGQADTGAVRRNVTAAFESEFEVEFQEGELSLTEHARYQKALAEIDTPDWVNLVQRPAAEAPACAAAQKFAGGVLHASLIHDRVAHRIREVRFNDDIDIAPWRTLLDLEAALRDTPVERLAHHVRAFFAARAVRMPALSPDDFIAVVRRALALPVIARNR